MFKLIKTFFTLLILLALVVFIWGSLIGWSNVEEKLKIGARKVVGLIYREATIHNPEGDLVPDEIDDQIKEQIKKTYREVKEQ
ncbi:MAG TPA: hypothetical protein GX706_00755 [Candidatus Moranbacteria bacterium]|nr:hypothetical protein [Candidatus Moranbacteria bacterium]